MNKECASPLKCLLKVMKCRFFRNAVLCILIEIMNVLQLKVS